MKLLHESVAAECRYGDVALIAFGGYSRRCD